MCSMHLTLFIELKAFKGKKRTTKLTEVDELKLSNEN